MTTREALNLMLQLVSQKADQMSEGYTDSDYDVMENYLTVTNDILAADYEDDPTLLPKPSEAPWCPDLIVSFLKENLHA